MSLWSRTARARSLAGIVAALAGSGQAPPPDGMPAYLREQYGAYGKVRLGESRAEIRRLDPAARPPGTGLSRADARRLRGAK